MGYVWSPCSLGSSVLLPPLSTATTTKKKKKTNQSFASCSCYPPQPSTFECVNRGGDGRREALLKLLSLSLALNGPNLNALASSAPDVVAPVNFREYKDDANKFQISVPQDWLVGAGDEADTGFNSITAFYPEQNPSSSVSVVITGLSADFTRIESFGKVDEFAETLVSGLDRSWKRPPGVTAKLIDSKASKGIYYIEYTLQNPGESRKHLLSALGMATNGWYNRLYTVTGQFLDENEEEYGSKIRKAVSSFKFI